MKSPMKSSLKKPNKFEIPVHVLRNHNQIKYIFKIFSFVYKSLSNFNIFEMKK